MPRFTITAVEIHVVSGPRPAAATGEPVQRQVNAVALYDRHRPPQRRAAVPAQGPLQSRYIRIGTDGGAEGFYGPIDPAVAWPVLEELRDVLIGQDALAGSAIWDILGRVDRHARGGHFKMAISAVDNALWDLRGRVFGAPVWQILGGSTRERIPAYASMLGTSLELDVVRERALETQEAGFRGQKWFLGDGPADGSVGLGRNVAVAETVRETLGRDTEIMFDVFRGWDLAYAIAWSQRVAHLLPTWLEEPFLPEKYPAFVALKRATTVPISAGEHLYDRADALPYLQDGLLAALQSDPEWCGGVTELTRICALAETFGVPVIPHGHGLHAALHVIASQSPDVCPKAEYLVRTMPGRHHFELNAPAPVNGSFALPDEPGFGIELDDSKIDERHLLQFA
jgi:L-rhamnonate dehydratase